MTVSVVQTAVGGGAGSGFTVTLADLPTAGHTLLAGVTAINPAATEDIPTPAGFTAITAIHRITLNNIWAGRLFYKISDGTEQAFTDPSTNSTRSIVVYAELDATVTALLASASGNRANPGCAPCDAYLGNRAADGFSEMTPGNGKSVVLVGWWYISGTGDSFGVPTIDQAAGVEVDHRRDGGNVSTAMVMLPVNPTAGGYRLTGSIISGDNYPSWSMGALEVTSTPTPGWWADWDGDGFDEELTSDPSAPLARALPESAPSGVSDEFTDRVLSASWNRGGSYDHIGQDGPGGCTLTLRNDDGRFDPDNVASPLYGKLVPGVPIWGGCIRDTGAWSGEGTVKGVFGGYVKTWSPTVDGSGQRVVEVICEDALGRYADLPVTVEPSLTRSHGDLREAILEALGESADRLSLESEPGTLQVSAVESTNGLSVLEELNQATGSRHFVTPGDTKEEWYFYTTVNKYHGLADAAAETINGDDITDVSGWVVTNENRIQQQRAEVQPVSLTSNNNVVWTSEVPLTVTDSHHKVMWATFDDYVFEATLNTAVSSGSISSVLTCFGKTAKIEIWATTASAVIGTLQVLGRQVVRGDTVGVVAGSTTPGARVGSTISSDFIGPLGAAQGLADFVVWKSAPRRKRPSFTVATKSTATHRTVVDRDLYDVVGTVIDSLSVTARRLEIIGLSGSAVPGRFFNVTYQTQETPNQSVVSWFTVGTDTVGSAVPIAPF